MANLLLNTRPISLRPSCSSTAVVAAAFHPQRVNIFALAFADGAVAAYDAVHLFRAGGKGDRRSRPAGTGKGGEISHLKRVHAVGFTITPARPDFAEDFGGHDGATMSTSIGSKSLGITSVAFVPESKATVVTVGANGKCCVFDFEGTQQRSAILVRSWHVRGPATSLSILSLNSIASNQVDGPAVTKNQTSGDVLLAIGRQDGRVLLYDLNGELAGEKIVDDEGARIIDVEWLSGAGGNETSSPRSGNSTPKTVRRKSRTSGQRKSLGSIMVRGRPIEEEVVAVLDDGEQVPLTQLDAEPIADSKSPSRAQTTREVLLPTTSNYMDFFSPVKTIKPCDTDAAPVATLAAHDDTWTMTSGSLERTRGFSTGSEATIKRRKTPPAVPASPTPRKDGKLAVRRAQTAKQTGPQPSSEASDSGRVLADVRSAGLALFAPYMQNKILKETFVPAKSSTAPSAQGTRDVPNSSGDVQSEDVWTDIIAEPPRKPSKNSSVASLKSRKTVSFRTSSPRPSEASNDTIIDWTTSSAHPRELRPGPLPQIGETRALPPSPPPKALAPAPQRSNTERESTFSTTDTNTSSADDTVIEWASFKSPSGRFKIHEDPEPEKYRPSSPRYAGAATNSPASTPSLVPSAANNLNPRSPASTPPSRSLKRGEKSRCDCRQSLQGEVAKVQTQLQADLAAFRGVMMEEFEKQKRWFEGRVGELEGGWREAEEGARRLELENRLLRGELAKERRGDVR